MPDDMGKVLNGTKITDHTPKVIRYYTKHVKERKWTYKDKDGKWQSYLRAPTFYKLDEFSELPCVEPKCTSEKCYAHMACERQAIDVFK
jgi:hypothetical protein